MVDIIGAQLRPINLYMAELAASTTGTSMSLGLNGASTASVAVPPPAVYANDFGAVADCTGQGVGTDVIPAIEAAIEQALDLYGDGARVVLLPGRYRASTAAVIDLQGKHDVQIELQGTITPDSTAMTMLEFRNAVGGGLTAAIYEGGVFNGYGDPFPYETDQYGAVADVVALGGQEAFLIRGWFDCTLCLSAYAYAARVLRTTERASVSHPQTGALKGMVKTMRNSDTSKPRCAQSIWADAGASVGTGNWGHLSHITADYDAWGPQWTNLNDVIISKFDAAYQFGGPKFSGCVVVEGVEWYIGDIDGNATGYHVEVGLSGARASEHVRVPKLRFTNAANGLKCDGVLHGAFKDIRTSGTAFTELVSLNNCQDVEATAYASAGARIFNVTGAFTNDVTIRPYGFGTLTDDQVTIAATVTQTVVIDNPILRDAAVGKSLIKVAGAAIVLVLSPKLSSSTGNMFDIASTTNNTYTFGGRVSGSGFYKSSISPFAVNGTIGLPSQISGTLRSNDGGNSGGAGGAFELGIAAAANVSFTPMAQVKGKLANSAGTELQGGVSLQFRPTGASGQTLQDGFEVSHTAVDGETVGLLLCRIAGSYSAKRVVLGAADSGGVGFKMLRVTN